MAWIPGVECGRGDLVPSVTDYMSGLIDIMTANRVGREAISRAGVSRESVGDGAVVVPVAIDDDRCSVHSMRHVLGEANLIRCPVLSGHVNGVARASVFLAAPDLESLHGDGSIGHVEGSSAVMDFVVAVGPLVMGAFQAEAFVEESFFAGVRTESDAVVWEVDRSLGYFVG